MKVFDKPIDDVTKQFEIDFFNHLIDTALNSLDDRFILLNDLCDKFGFLFNIRKLSSASTTTIEQYCSELQNCLSDKNEMDIEGADLATELVTLSKLLTNDVNHDLNMHDTLTFIYEKGLNEIFPNCCIALRILLTLPVTVVSAERSISKLKLIKTYLRSTLTQEKLSGLAMISIGHKQGKQIDYNDLIEKFAAVKSRRKPV